jgi:hypothetical protein
MKDVKFQLTGVAPIILHSNQTVDPLNPYAKQMKSISSKRSKTEADFEAMSKIEFFASLYTSEGRVIIPDKMLNAVFVAGAMKDKNGPLAKAGAYFDQHAILEYDGPKDPEELWKAGEPFVFRCPVKVQRNTVIRTRAMFPGWSATVSMQYEESIIDIEQIILAWNKAGAVVGMGDWRPRYGRFVADITE